MDAMHCYIKSKESYASSCKDKKLHLPPADTHAAFLTTSSFKSQMVTSKSHYLKA